MPYESPLPDVTIPDVPLSDFVLRACEREGDRPALIDAESGASCSFAELRAQVEAGARWLSDHGVGRGDRVVLVSPNSIEMAVALLSIARAGAVASPANPLYTAGELRRQIEGADARLVLTSALAAGSTQAACREAGQDAPIVIDGPEPFFVSSGAGPGPRVEIDPSRDLVALPFSSGTTGAPKGVMLTHRNLVANILQFRATDALGRDDVALGLLPFFHIYGMVVVLLSTIHAGRPLVIVPRFDLEDMLCAMSRHGVTIAYLVPPVILKLATDPRVSEHRLRLRLVTSGAAPLSAELAERAAARLSCEVRQGYGLTETSPVTHCCLPGMDKPGSVGPSVPNTRWRIVDPETGREVPPGERGEIRIQGPQVMSGYLGHEQATRDAFDGEGYLRTGDIGRADEEGCLYVVDRLKELIKCKGLQVAPAELEALLLQHERVADAAVVGRPDAERGEVPVAFVVARGEVAAGELMAYVEEHVARYKRLREVRFVREIPKSPAGKILRRELRERL